MNNLTGGPSAPGGSATAPNNDAGLGASSAAALIRVLLDLGPACTSNVGTLREALRLVNQKLPDAGGGGDVGVGSGWKEGGVARLLHFFSAVGSTAKRAVSTNDGGSASEAIEQQQQQQQRNDLSAAFVGAYLNNPDFYKQDSTSGGVQGRGFTEWNLEVVSQVISSDLAHLNWHLVARSLDFPEFKIRSVQHLEILQRLYRSGAQGQQLPLDVITLETWSNRIGQLSILRHLLLLPPNVYNFPLDAEETLDASTAIVEQGSVMVANNNIVSNTRGWASSKVLQRLLHLSDDKSLHPAVREIFVVGLLTSPEIILCALVRLQLSVTRSADQASGEDARAIATANAVAGMPMKGELMRELIPMFFKPAQGGVAVGGGGGAGGLMSVGGGAAPLPKQPDVVRNLPGALRRLWSISQNTVVAACIEAWRSTSNDLPQVRFHNVVHIIGVVRILPAPETAIATILNGNKDQEFSFAVAFVMADHDMLQLRSWLTDRWNAHAGPNKSIFADSLTTYIGKYYTHATPRQSKPLVSIENLATALQFLLSLDLETILGVLPTSTGNAKTLAETVKGVVNDCMARHPSLGELIPNARPTSGDNRDSSPNLFRPIASQEEIEDLANQYFQQIYSSEDSARKVVETLKAFRTSGTARDNEVFQCMIHNLFDEYRFFSKYPEKELRITGILFGLLIKEQLVSSITLGIALRYILEALRKPPSQSPQSSKMFRFGMFALEQFKERLHEWPQYCSHIVQIPHLKEEYSQLVSEIESAMSSDNGSAASSTSAGGLAAGRGQGAIEGAGGGEDAADSSRATENGGDNESGNDTSVGVNVLGGEISVPTHNKNQFSGVHMDERFVGAGIANITTTTVRPIAVGGVVEPVKFELAIPLKDPLKPRKAVFGPGLGRAVNSPSVSTNQSGESSSSSIVGESSQIETPPDTLLDRVQFLINNLSMSNVESKSHALRGMLERKYFGWLGNYLVVKRISTQPNFHSLYLSFLDNLGMDYGRGLVEAILASVYVNVGKLLRSQKITTSTSERSLLKNLGSWLGQITLARNRPILQIMLDCKELLFQGYETGMLIAVAPFVAKILEGAKNSTVFRPPNPWLMGLLGVFRSLYNVDDLKMNIKFEVEVLCKNLGLKLEDISMRNDADLGKRVSPVKEKNPDFNMKSQSSTISTPSKQSIDQGLALSAANAMLSSPDNKSNITITTGGDSTKSVDGDQQHHTVIPNLAAYVNVNPNLTQLFHQVQGGPLATHVSSDLLKRSVPVAVDRAIREIIQPVVERSVSIACITTKAIVTKDFAMEADENKMRKAAQLMVANLAGSLALVTCREPLHTSISSHLRTLLMNAINSHSNASSSASGAAASSASATVLQEPEMNALDQCVAICSTENLELGCMLIEKAATEKAVRDMDEALAVALSTRKSSRDQGQPYYDMSIFQDGNGRRYPKDLPDPLRPKPGGLRPEQLLVYEAFQRAPRQPTAPSSAQGGSIDGQGARSSNIDQLEVENQQPQGEGGSLGTSAGLLNLNAINAIAIKLDSSVSTLLNTAGPRAQDISLAMIPPEHEIKQLISAVPRVVAATPLSDDLPRTSLLSSAETDLVLSFSQGIFKRLYEVNLSERLRLEALISLLEMLNKICPQLGRDIGTWATYAPTKTDMQRKLHRAVLLLLVRSDLIQMGDLDSYLAKNADEGRDEVWLEFLILFVRTAVVESIAPPSKMPRMIYVIRMIAEDRSPVSHEINPAFRKAATRLLEEHRFSLDSGGSRSQAGESIKGGQIGGTTRQPTYEESSSMSPASLKNLTDASLVIAKTSHSFASADPPNAKQLVTEILVGWLRVQNDATSNDKIMAQFLQRLQQQFGVGSYDDQTERFLRLATEVVIESCTKNVDVENGLNYQAIDGYAKLLSSIVLYLNGGGSTEQVSQQRLGLLNKALGVITRSLITSYEKAHQSSAQWNQRPWFRLLLDLACELNIPNPALDTIKAGMNGIFGSAFHVVQPLVVPGTTLHDCAVS